MLLKGENAMLNGMLKRIGITMGLCGLTILGGVGLSMAQSVLDNGFGVDENLSSALEEARDPVIAGVQYVAYMPQNVPLDRLLSDAPLASVDASLQMHIELDPLPGHVRPVARPELVTTPQAEPGTATQPVFGQPVVLPVYNPSQSVSVSRYEPTKLRSAQKLQSRALIGVFR